MSLPLVINPEDLILWVDFLWINTFCSKWYFVLLVVVDWCHFFDKADEDRHCIFREMEARMSASSQNCNLKGEVRQVYLRRPAKSKSLL